MTGHRPLNFRSRALFIKNALISIFISFLIASCAATPEVKRPDPLPSYVREIKQLKVLARQNNTDTGIDLSQGEAYSIMARGTIHLDRTSSFNPSNASYKFNKYVGEKNFGSVFLQQSGSTSLSPATGRLYLGISDSNYSDNSGYFDVTIVVWKTTDYAQLAYFLEKFQQANPDHIGISDAYSEAIKLSSLQNSIAETSMQMELTKEQIQLLNQGESQPHEPTPPSQKEYEAQLENSLEQLTAKLSQLETMNKELQQEKEKAAQLSRELEGRERREKELLGRIGTGAKIPPLLLITSPEDGRQNETDSVRLTGAVEDDQGLMRIEVLVNGRPVESGDARGIRPVEGTAPKRLSFERRILLAQGANRILVKATDTDGLTSERGLTVHYSTSRRNVWAVVIGINDYPQLPKLKYAVNDAREFHRFLTEKNRVPAENITLLINDQASLKNLRSTLGTRLKNAAGQDDMVIIFFAGHGATERDAMSADGDGLEKYLLPWETDPADLYSTAMPMREIAHIFGRIRSDRLIFIADSCYSGASGGRTISVTGTRANITDGFLERISGGRGKVIITASAANEVSVEKDDLQHGVFTYYLLEGLRGAADADRDGTVTVDEAYRYVSEKVPRATGQEQHPVKKGSVEGNLVFGIVR
jgi:hypothetical protein